MGRYIKVHDLYLRTRLVLNDLQKTKYSDFEVQEAINAAVEILCEALSRYYSPELVRSFPLQFDDENKCELPPDFYYVISLTTPDEYNIYSAYERPTIPLLGYRIEGDYIYVSSFVSEAILRYMAQPSKILEPERAKPTDEVNLDVVYLNCLSAMTKNLLAGEYDAAAEKANAAAQSHKGDKIGIISDPPMWSTRVTSEDYIKRIKK